MTEITLYNTRTRSKETFAPLDPSNVRMYVCGPTVYDRAHLGNARPVVVFDVLFRLLRHVYGPDHVSYVRNFTDVDDKINARAREMQEAGDGSALNDIVRALTDETIAWYHQDMGELGTLPPTHEPRATEWIGAMVAMIEGLLARGCAYEAEGHVLFDVRSYPEYGRLSGRSVDDMIAGSRVEVAPYKRDPMDFVLWKPSSADEPGWESPWGRGRPGWHIECSAMSRELLGESFDIHGGGIDLQFPHHENEIAQSRCAHPEGDFARVWMHNEMVQVEGKKMSKSLGNFFTVRDLLDQGWPGEVIRFVMLRTHYRKPMDWTEEKAREYKRDWDRWVDTLSKWVTTLSVDHEVLDMPLPQELVADEIIEALADDLNTSLAMTHLKRMGRFIDNSAKFLQLSDHDQRVARQKFAASAEFLGFDIIAKAREMRDRPAQNDLEYFELELAQARAIAKETRNFSEVDRVKAALINAGVEVRMGKERIELIPGPDFDPSKLETLK